MKNKIFALALAALALSARFNASADERSLAAANRKTAERFLRQARGLCAQESWAEASSAALMGLKYDESVADLWYVNAKALDALGAKRSLILPLVEKSLDGRMWVERDRENARILRAKILADIERFDDAISCLDEKPLVYSADAEAVRALSYYKIGTAESVGKARAKILSASKIYPDDKRFPILFFQNELQPPRKTMDSAARSLTDIFIARAKKQKSGEIELSLWASFFARGDDKARLARAFDAAGGRHPLYALAALDSGILDDEKAAEYFFSFADKSIDIALLEEFLKRVQSDGAKRLVKSHLESYEGAIESRSAGAKNVDTRASYSRGRPSLVIFDKNNDGANEWAARCDFGETTSVSMPGENLEIFYGEYPRVSKISKKDGGRESTLIFADGSFSWEPFSFSKIENSSEKFGCEFFIPRVSSEDARLDMEMAARAADRSVSPCDEREGATVERALENGETRAAEYFCGGKIYARAFFEDGAQVSREVDNDGDGFFETTEIFSRGGEPRVVAVQIDMNGDTHPDYMEEYSDGAKILSWDDNGDGVWDERYERRENSDGSVSEKSSFAFPPLFKKISVETLDGESVKVSTEAGELAATEGRAPNVFWLGERGTEDDEKKALDALDAKGGAAGSLVVDGDGKRMFAARIGGKSYIKAAGGE